MQWMFFIIRFKLTSSRHTWVKIYSLAASRRTAWSKPRMKEATEGSRRQAAAGRGLNSGWLGWSSAENRSRIWFSMDFVRGLADGKCSRWHSWSSIEGTMLDRDRESVWRTSVWLANGSNNETNSSSRTHSLVSNVSILSSASPISWRLPIDNRGR